MSLSVAVLVQTVMLSPNEVGLPIVQGSSHRCHRRRGRARRQRSMPSPWIPSSRPP